MPKTKYSVSTKKKLQTGVWIVLLFLINYPVFSQRAFSLRSPAFNIKGDAVIVGNRLIAGASAANDNNATVITQVDLDGDATTTTNSSSANLTLPVGSAVSWAGLYWAGRSVNASRNTIKFKKSGGTYSTYTATQLDNGNTISGITTENHYQGFVDVTTYVSAQGAGTYWAGDVFTTVGNGAADPANTGYYAGWAMIVIYTDNSQPYRNITVFDGYSSVWSGNGTGTVTVPVSGFLTPSSGTFSTKFGVVAWEGDKNITNDKLRINANVDANNVSDANNPSTNFFNGTITNTPRNPSTAQNWGVDFDYITSNVSPPLNSTSTNVYFNTSGDFYLPGALVFTIDINPVLLPVELLSFDAAKKDTSVMLQWATASESNNDYFEIERSLNSSNWQPVGRIAGQGRSSSYQFYEWEDETAAEFAKSENASRQMIYYRLKQVDFNKKYGYSDIRQVRFENAAALNFSIYPNPVSNNAKINFTSPGDSVIDVKIIDTNGKMVLASRVSNKNFKDFDLRNLKSGAYFIEAKTEDGFMRKRFLVE